MLGKRSAKSYLCVPFVLGLFFSTNIVAADEAVSSESSDSNSLSVLNSSNVSNDELKEVSEINTSSEFKENIAEELPAEKENVSEVRSFPVSGFRSATSAAVSRSERVTSRTAVVTEVTKTLLDEKGISLQYTKPVVNGERISFAVWSDDRGQDDLIWYHANNQGAAYVDLDKHKSVYLSRTTRRLS